MRLRKINLSGFKSFVDPTTIGLPGNLIGVVGPNGCGKSNVIDAVRWVMGEVSAKHLRGDSMADVIFNGSTSRKPVGQASVELVFDNSEGRAGGQYAQYAEISVKRQVSREGQSTYFLNSSRCRRRDIMDIFLGTGLGPRSYAIIEQGMISRLIEARPEELRDFLEEAAGISKYKERRRETENRIRHTRENLDRLNDIRDELARQLTHLKRQATMAEKYKLYKADERRAKVELLGLRWRQLDGEVVREEHLIEAQKTVFEAAVAEQRRTESELENQREHQTQVNEAFNEAYRQVMDAGSEIAQVEANIKHLKRRGEQATELLGKERSASVDAERHLQSDERRLTELAAAMGYEQPRAQELEIRATQAREVLDGAEQAMNAWNATWDNFNQRAQQPAQAAQGERARIQHLDERLSRIGQRDSKLAQELEGLSPQDLQETVVGAKASLAGCELEQERIRQSIEERREALSWARDEEADHGKKLHAVRERLQQARGRLASLTALQQDALGKNEGRLQSWLRTQGLEDLPRLAEVIKVDDGWEGAVEFVLGGFLEALCADGGIDGAAVLERLDSGRLCLLDEAHRGSIRPRDGWSPLSDKIVADRSIGDLVGHVYTAPDMATARAMRAQLLPGESVITPNGHWYGPSWLSRQCSAPGEEGILARERVIDDLQAETGEMNADREALEQGLEHARTLRRNEEEALAGLQDSAAGANRQYAILRAELGGRESELEQTRSRIDRLIREREELGTERVQVGEALSKARMRLERLTDEMADLEMERVELSQSRDGIRARLSESRSAFQSARDEAHRVGTALQTMLAESNTLRQAQARYRDQVTRLQQRCEELDAEVIAVAAPLQAAQSDLGVRLGRHREAEAAMKTARATVEAVDDALRRLEDARLSAERKVEREREVMEDKRIHGQEVRTRRQTVEEQLDETGAEVAAVLESLPEDAEAKIWEQRLEDLARRIVRLGPINLAAIEEHAEQSERKQYLDAQHGDLEEALATLESAIQKIDRETRARFKETYEKVNIGLERLFPRLFGGGRAYLELTGDDLLHAGVAVMARPPGKRNSTIHLLSGGEKALTAVALVFSIFELNPAPFCLLDEVDAPLDDANVGRFCSLMQEISEQVQLIVITHNKATMEITKQLIGVTMHEPGVSRLVTVDIEQAVELASA